MRELGDMSFWIRVDSYFLFHECFLVEEIGLEGKKRKDGKLRQCKRRAGEGKGRES